MVAVLVVAVVIGRSSPQGGWSSLLYLWTGVDGQTHRSAGGEQGLEWNA
jgi:hypothetical protein